jgi:hypothetical protein
MAGLTEPFARPVHEPADADGNNLGFFFPSGSTLSRGF